jgi:hypothetical protein
LKILADGNRAVTLDDHHRMILELFDDLLRFCHRRRILWNNGNLADGVFLLETDGNETLMCQGKREHHWWMNMNDGLGIGAPIHGEMQRRFARGALRRFARLPIMINLHEILRHEKTERRVLPGN